MLKEFIAGAITLTLIISVLAGATAAAIHFPYITFTVLGLAVFIAVSMWLGGELR